MANQEHKQNKNTNHKRRNANPPARYALRHPAEKQNKKRTGPGPTKNNHTQDLPRTQWWTATVSQLTKRCTNELVATQKSETRFLIVVADRQQRKALAVHYCILASQSPLTSSCSGVRFKTNCVCRVPNGGFRSRKSKLLAAKLQLYRPPYGEQLRGSG